jgi:hypothetical protein
VATHGSTVTLSGTVSPPAQEAVEVYLHAGAEWDLVAEGESGADGSYLLSMTARRPGQLVARSGSAESTPVRLQIRPRLTASFRGLTVLGAPLDVRGQLVPARAGRVNLTVRGTTRTLALSADGRFAARVSTRRAGRLEATLVTDPAPGYVAVRRTLATTIRTPILRIGTKGDAVLFFEKRLRSLHYALPQADSAYGPQTRDAVYAFQKVEGLARDGIVGPHVWRTLLIARTPRAALRQGSHIEVDKARQVLFEVRRGHVVRIAHVSTGATGNTPAGRWRIYWKSPGYNASGMYYSMYFLRGFAIHGYASVPPYPASHGCVRTPLWFGPRIYGRWPVGSLVLVR